MLYVELFYHCSFVDLCKAHYEVIAVIQVPVAMFSSARIKEMLKISFRLINPCYFSIASFLIPRTEISLGGYAQRDLRTI